MKWIHISDIGDAHEVRCSNCNYKVTYHGDKIPKKCLFCREVPDPISTRPAGSKFRYPTKNQ